MIYFKNLRFKNFLSFGEQWTEIQLDRSPTTLVTGPNGAGKSTFLDALTFALYNKPFREINKPQLVNSVNNKGLLVEVEFSIGKKEYLIRRGIKPNKFEVIEDGKTLDQEGSARDQQNHLEKNILQMNYTAFTQIVILGKATYVPFMRLSTPDRRQVIEDLLGLKIFTTMNKVLKAMVSSLKEELRDVEAEVESAADKIEVRQRYIDKIQAARNEQTAQIEENIAELESEVATHMSSADKLEVELGDLGEPGTTLKPLRTKRDKMTSMGAQLREKVRNLTKEIDFFSDNETCPTCGQDISEDFRTEQLEKNQSKVEKLQEGQATLTSDLQSLEAEIDKIEDALREIHQIESAVSSHQSSINDLQRQITRLQQQRDKAAKGDDADLNEEQDKLKSLQRELKKIEKKREALKDTGAYYTAIAGMLKDGGIKSLIIEKYLPIFNQFINQYLNQMGFFVQFNLDPEFNETILSRYRDNFSYASFSEGQKLRIDLAILLTWREIAKLKNSLNTNLLIMDEVFDSSLDQAGVDAFVDMIPAMSDTNVFVVSHTPDKLVDKFRSEIAFKMENNFSEMVHV
jgi:DNA repair exonuclease SbcCD ATPase subunit